MKIITLIGDGPESSEEFGLYENVNPIQKQLHIKKTTLPINPAKNFDDWIRHIFHYSESLARDWRTHHNIH